MRTKNQVVPVLERAKEKSILLGDAEFERNLRMGILPPAPPHPGPFIRLDCMEPLGLTVSQAARDLKISRKHMNNLINGRVNITVSLAVALERAYDPTAEYWLNMQQAYDLWHARYGEYVKKRKR